MLPLHLLAHSSTPESSGNFSCGWRIFRSTLDYDLLLWKNYSSISQAHWQNLHSSDNQADQFQKAKMNTIKTFLLMTICFVICWSNNQVLYLLYNLGYDVDWDGTFNKFTVLMAFGNCTINPFVYLINYRDYQEALKSCFSCQSPTIIQD